MLDCSDVVVDSPSGLRRRESVASVLDVVQSAWDGGKFGRVLLVEVRLRCDLEL